MPLRPREHQLDSEAQKAFESALPPTFVPRQQSPDYGIDYTVEVFDDSGQATGLMFNVQLKGSDLPLEKALSSIRFKTGTADYFRSLTLPVLVVLFHRPSSSLYCRWFHAYDPDLAKNSVWDEETRKSVPFVFRHSDLWTDDTPGALVVGATGFEYFRSPALILPLPLHVAGPPELEAELTLAIRGHLAPADEVVFVERGVPDARALSVTVQPETLQLSIGDVASITMPRSPDDSPIVVADQTAGLLVAALAMVGRAEIASRVASRVGPSGVLRHADLATLTAGAMHMSGNFATAIDFEDRLRRSNEPEEREAAIAFAMFDVTSSKPRSTELHDKATSLARENVDRLTAEGNNVEAAMAAYNLGGEFRRQKNAQAAVGAYLEAADLDPRYLARAYFHGDLAGMYFESNEFDLSATHYRRALDLENGGLTPILLADALLWTGEYEESLARMAAWNAEHLGDPDCAEWRLKEAALRRFHSEGFVFQVRNEAIADEREQLVDLSQATNATAEGDIDQLRAALKADACCSEAWFKLAIIEVCLNDDPQAGAESAMISAVLHRADVAKWHNAIMCERRGHGERLSDLVRCAVRFTEHDLVADLSEVDFESSSYPLNRAEFFELVDETQRELQEKKDRPSGTLRFHSGDEFEEIVLGE